mmetsp:Transcript_102939/g.332114  ORF Transcript_102939/g.332114 Transcript_102939/m.332114 type:complete len:344 (+) Transcript_102939:1227-2258(+)
MLNGRLPVASARVRESNSQLSSALVSKSCSTRRATSTSMLVKVPTAKAAELSSAAVSAAAENTAACTAEAATCSTNEQAASSSAEASTSSNRETVAKSPGASALALLLSSTGPCFIGGWAGLPLSVHWVAAVACLPAPFWGVSVAGAGPSPCVLARESLAATPEPAEPVDGLLVSALSTSVPVRRSKQSQQRQHRVEPPHSRQCSSRLWWTMLLFVIAVVACEANTCRNCKSSEVKQLGSSNEEPATSEQPKRSVRVTSVVSTPVPDLLMSWTTPMTVPVLTFKGTHMMLYVLKPVFTSTVLLKRGSLYASWTMSGSPVLATCPAMPTLSGIRSSAPVEFTVE